MTVLRQAEARNTLRGIASCRVKTPPELIGSSEEPAPTLLAPVSLETVERSRFLFVRQPLQGP